MRGKNSMSKQKGGTTRTRASSSSRSLAGSPLPSGSNSVAVGFGSSQLDSSLASDASSPFLDIDSDVAQHFTFAWKDPTTVSQASTESSHLSWKFDQHMCRLAVAKMIIIDELPFSYVEREGFREMMSVVQPRFQVPSRTTVIRDCLKIYIEEKQKLKEFFSKFSRRVCLTTNMWTSCQNLNYMCLTAHFIDDDWQLQKKVLNFSQVASHDGLTIGRAIEGCLLHWGISKIFTITIDNARSNDAGINYLKNRLESWKGSVLDGDFLHMRCCTHIWSLIVKEGLQEMDDSIVRIRSAVRYVRSSPTTLQRFKNCAKQEKIDNRSLLVLDVETKWNSTYLMLDMALKFQKAFDLLEIQDIQYRDELTRGEKSRGLPMPSDWEYVRCLLPFMKIFYNATLRVSNPHVTGNAYMLEIYFIRFKISEWCKSNDPGISTMAAKFKEKYDKYWSNVDNINLMLFIAVVLDPRYKLECVNWVIDKSFDVVNANKLKTKVKETLFSLFELYKSINASLSTQSSESEIDVNDPNLSNEDFMIFMFLKYRAEQQALDPKSELDIYLEEPREVDRDKKFDILNWWRGNSKKYRVLALIAWDVLAMPVSTVTSESAFSTDGCILDSFRSSLTPNMVEALICTRDWIRTNCEPLIIEESLDELSNIESEFSSLAMENTCVHLDD